MIPHFVIPFVIITERTRTQGLEPRTQNLGPSIQDPGPEVQISGPRTQDLDRSLRIKTPKHFLLHGNIHYKLILILILTFLNKFFLKESNFSKFTYWSEWKVLQAMEEIKGKQRVTPKGTWVSVRWIEIPCSYFLCGAKVHKSNVWEKYKQCKRDLIFWKTRVFILLS